MGEMNYQMVVKNMLKITDHFMDTYGMEIFYIFNLEPFDMTDHSEKIRTITIKFNSLSTFDLTIPLSRLCKEYMVDEIIEQYKNMCVDHCSKAAQASTDIDYTKY